MGRGKRFERGKRKFPLRRRRCALALIHGAPAAAGGSFSQLTHGETLHFLPESVCHVYTHPRAQCVLEHSISRLLTSLVRQLCWWRPWCLGQPQRWHTKKRGFRWKALGTATPTHALAVVCCNSRSPLWIFLFPCGKGGLSSKDWKMPISCSVVYALHFLGKDTVISRDGWTGNTEEKIIQIERFSLKSQVNKCCKQMQRFKEQIRRE